MRAGRAGGRDLLARLDTANLPKLIPRLSPEVLHQAIQARGLEDSAEFIAFATPAQLSRILDADVWSGAPGGDERFDVERFGVWLAVLMQAGAAVAAEKIVGLDIELVIAGLSRHIVVFDHAAIAPFTTSDEVEVPGRARGGGAVARVGDYVIEPRRASAWDAIVELLTYLHVQHAAYFDRVIRRCMSLSDGDREVDGCDTLMDDRAQGLFDVGAAREVRRESRGFVTPADARAFLKAARAFVIEGERAATAEPDLAAATAIELHRGRFPLLQQLVSTHPTSVEELAYLANVLVAGCSIQGRAFTPAEAKDAVAATANLGLESFADVGRAGTLVRAFEAGWSVLHRDVSMQGATRLIKVIGQLHCADRDIHRSLQSLRRELRVAVRAGEPWRARTALEAILMIDATSWAALNALIDECPTLHAAIGASAGRTSIDVSDYEFIAQRSQLAVVRTFLDALPDRLVA